LTRGHIWGFTWAVMLPHEVLDLKTIIRKICLLGDNCVGKTSLIRRFVFSQFDESYITTIGTTISKKSVPLTTVKAKERIELKMIIWDVSGQKEFRRVHASALGGAKGALIVCDRTRPETLESIRRWMDSMRKYAGEVPVVFLANKSDLEDEVIVTEENISQVAGEYNVPYVLTSAKTGDHVEDAFGILGQAMLSPFTVTYPSTLPVKDGEEEVTIYSLVDEMVATYCDRMGDIGLAMSIVRKQFADAEVNFLDPTPEKLEEVADKLADTLVHFKGMEKADQVREELKKLINSYGNPYTSGNAN